MKDSNHTHAAAMITVEPDGLGIESGNPQWDRARKILEGVKMTFRMNLAGQVLLGGELLEIKNSLGFKGRGGDRRSKSHNDCLIDAPRTWDQWCKQELGISQPTADRCIACYRLIQRRGEELGEDSPALRLLCAPVSALDEGDRKILGNLVNSLLKGESQKELLQQLKIARPPHVLTGGDTSKFKNNGMKPGEVTAEMAAAWFGALLADLHKLGERVSHARHNKQFDVWIYLLPLEDADPRRECLTGYRNKMAQLSDTIESDMKAVLGRIGKAIESKTESCNHSPKTTANRKQRTKR